MALQFDKHFGINVTALRYFSVYGPGQPTEGPYGLVMGIFLKSKSLAENGVIYGDGTQRRDFIHVEDVAAANLAAFESPFHGKALNVGSGTNYSINELASLIGIECRYETARSGEALETLAEISDTKKFRNWKPRVSLPQGLGKLL